jgi:hypothetical protein
MRRQSQPSLILVSVTCLIVILTECVISARIRPRHAPSPAQAYTQTPPSLKKYLPQRVGKFKLTGNTNDEQSTAMKRSWVSLFGATDLARGIYLIPDPKAQSIARAVEAAVLLTVASFPSHKEADSAATSLANMLMGRGYTIERKRLGKSRGRGARAEVTLARSQNADDWVVFWSRSSVVFQVQAVKQEKVLDFAQSYPY